MAYMTKWWLKSNVEKEMPHSPVKVEITEFSGELNNIRNYETIEGSKKIDDIFLALKLENEEKDYAWDSEKNDVILTNSEMKYLKIYFSQSDVEKLLAILNSKLNLN